MVRIDFPRLVEMLTPRFLRGSVMLAWLRTITQPMADIYRRFVLGREDDLFRESIDSTVPRLEYMLNYIFHKPGLQDGVTRITVDTVASPDLPILHSGIYMGFPSGPDFKLLYLDKDTEPVSLYGYDEISRFSYDFVVKIPQAVECDRDRMDALLASYALPDKYFTTIIT